MDNKFEKLLNDLEKAYADNNVAEVNRINALLMGDLEVSVSESALDFELMESVKGKAVSKTLEKFIIKEETLKKGDVLKLLSSLVTHIIIESEVKKKDLNNYPIKILLNLIDGIVVDEGVIKDAKKFLYDRYGRFI